MAESKITKFRRTVWAHYRKHGRHNLPWRATHDPYKILVSEVMLQQTQVKRAIPFYKKFIRTFPTASKLARAPLSEVLRTWQGLGYNRRAKMLREAAEGLAERKKLSIAELEALPGVGPYTARAVAAFAYNENTIFIETNIRTAIIHNFFPRKKKTSDAEIEKILAGALPKGKAREWYGALMDYGSFLKRSGLSYNAKSHAYVQQSAFKGSMRQARGAILKALVHGSASTPALTKLLGTGRRVQMRSALGALIQEGLVRKKAGKCRLAD